MSSTLLKAILSRLSLLNIRPLSSSTDSVAVTSAALPTNAAVETGGHLAAIDTSTSTTSTQTTASATATGTIADAAYAGSGSSTLVAALKGVYAALKGTLSIRALTSATDTVTIVPSGTQTIATAQLPATLGVQTAANSISFTPASDAGTMPISNPGGALALDASVVALTNAVKAQIGIQGTVWFDATVDPVLYFVRRETVNEGTGAYTVAWENLDGTAASPTVTNLKSISNAKNIDQEHTVYTATSGGTGYASGDILIHAFGVNTAISPPTLAYSFWLNAGPSATGVLATAPTNGTYASSGSSSVTVTASALPSNAAQETGGNLAAAATSTATTATGVGGVADTAYAGSGSSSIIAALKGVYAAIKGTLSIRALTAADVVTNVPAAPTVGTVATAAINQTASVALASNAARKACYLKNDDASASRIYLSPASSCSTTLYQEWLDPGDTLATQFGDYTGAYYAVTAAGGSATLRVTEYA